MALYGSTLVIAVRGALLPRHWLSLQQFFEGSVISVRDLERNDQIVSSADPTTVEFEVTTVWKGRENWTIHLTTPRGESSCGFAFVEGVEYIVHSLNGFPVYLSSRTNRLSAAWADLAALGEGQVLGQGTPISTPGVSERGTGGLWDVASHDGPAVRGADSWRRMSMMLLSSDSVRLKGNPYVRGVFASN